MNEDNHIKEQWQLLQSLRSTVEGLLVYGVSNVWNVYGGLNRLHSVIEQIFKHGCRIFDPLGEPDCWVFIQGLNWIQPESAASPNSEQYDDYLANVPARIVSRKDILWMYKSLENHSLSQKLSWLLSNKEHLLYCLEPWAFLCQESLAEATLIYLRAVERNQAALLTEIDPSLVTFRQFFPGDRFLKNSPKRHRRSASYPINFGNTRTESNFPTKNSCDDIKSEDGRVLLREVENVDRRPEDNVDGGNNSKTVINDNGEGRENGISLKSWNSLPVLCKDHEVCQKSCVSPLTAFMAANRVDENTSVQVPRTIELSEVIKVDYSEVKQSSSAPNIYGKTKKQKTSSRKQRSKTKSSIVKNMVHKNDCGSSDTLNYEDTARTTIMENIGRTTQNVGAFHADSSASESIKIETHQKTRRRSFFSSSGSAPEFSGSWSIDGQKDIRTPKKSFMEDGGSSVQPMATGYFPRPLKGQSLTSFLSSSQFSRANAELDRENAHFSISEAMIAAIEQLKCNPQLRLIDETADESDEEINNLKQRIRLRRRQRQMEQRKGNWSRDFLSDEKTDTTTTDQSVSPLSSSPGTSSDVISTDGVEEIEIDDARNLSHFRSSGVSMSMASLYSDADLYHASPRQGAETTLTDNIISAEGVALSLISKFSERHLPRASELEWLVSEKDAPQQLLPLPRNWSVNPEDGQNEEISQVIPLRGTIEWAPPRPQIIFTPHPQPVQKTLIAKQNYRCAGCGMKVAVEYANRFRYCEYLGRYFCTGCHTNQVALIPGKILSKWDFNRYTVSNFSYRLLDKMATDPLFQVNDLNPLLYRRVKQLERTRVLRTQLYFLKDFLLTCRFAQSIQDILKKQPNYMINDPHVYSMQDLMFVKVGVLTAKLEELVKICCSHVSECVLCEARGFVCELCPKKDCKKETAEVIFPWQLTKVTRCGRCGSCFHIECKNLSNSVVECPRCERVKARRDSKDS